MGNKNENNVQHPTKDNEEQEIRNYKGARKQAYTEEEKSCMNDIGENNENPRDDIKIEKLERQEPKTEPKKEEVSRKYRQINSTK